MVCWCKICMELVSLRSLFCNSSIVCVICLLNDNRGWTLEMYLDEQNGIYQNHKLTLWSHLKNQEYEAGLVCGYESYLFMRFGLCTIANQHLAVLMGLGRENKQNRPLDFFVFQNWKELLWQIELLLFFSN